MSLSPAAAADRRPPLLLAIDNAQRVRLGQEPAAAGAWRGCASGAWCSREARHCGPCDADASVPSLLAYPAEELFESGVNLEELCHLPQQLAEATASPLAPETDSEGGEGAAAADCLSSGKRRADTEADADAEADDGASHSQSGMRASSGSPAAAAAAAAGEEEQQSGGSSHAAKRPRSIAVPSIPAPAAAAAELTLSAPALPADSSSRGLQAADGFVPVCAGMIPVSVPQFAPPVPPLPGCSAASRNRGRPAGAPRLRAIARTAAPEPTAAPAAAAAAVTITPNKPVTRQQPRTPDSAAATGECQHMPGCMPGCWLLCLHCTALMSACHQACHFSKLTLFCPAPCVCFCCSGAAPLGPQGCAAVAHRERDGPAHRRDSH
jgi:hypothetical protein